MCGRYDLNATPRMVEAVFANVNHKDFPPRYNIAPTQPVAVLRLLGGRRHLNLMRWGLVPAWVEDPRDFSLLVNARAETAAERPAFNSALRYRRCLFPATGFYEWQRGPGGRKQPYWIRPRGEKLIALAGPLGDLVRPQRRRGRHGLHPHHLSQYDGRADPRPHAGGHCAW